MPTLYEIYMSALAERMSTEVEKKGIISQNQTGFRKGMEIVDNIYILNYLIGS